MVRDVRVFDGERVTERRSVLVQDGIIAQVGGSGLAVPTGLDMFTASTRFERIKAIRAADAPELASVRTAGVGATAPIRPGLLTSSPKNDRSSEGEGALWGE